MAAGCTKMWMNIRGPRR